MSKCRLFLSFILLTGIYSQPAMAQSQILDNNPAWLKWKQIQTPHFKILFPQGLERKATHVANLMEHIYLPVSKSLNKMPKKIPLILQNQNSVANGFVTLGPRRSEFFTTPPQDYNFLGTNDWFNLLAVHEFRHVVQFDKSLTGFNKFFYYLFGQASQSLWANLSVPDWFWEGDAVGIETALTPSGRGRIPSFDRVFRANLLEKGPFSYNKQHLRSYKDFVPDHYRLGYFLTTHVRNQYGAESWSHITEKAFGLPFIPFTFSNALKRETGKNLLQNYKAMMVEMEEIWKDQLNDLSISGIMPVSNRKNKAFTNYNYPQLLENGEILALKSGIGDIFQFVTINHSGAEMQVYVPGIVNQSAMLSVENDVIAWNEIYFDQRWGKSSYGVIKTYDIKNKKLNVVGNKTRYAGAALSPNANKLATILTTKDNQYALVIIDVKSGKEIKRFPIQTSHFYSMPRWVPNGDAILVLKTGQEGKSVVSLHVATGNELEIIPPSHENIGHPVQYENYLLYNSPVSGIDNIYALNLKTNQKFQVTSSKYGAYNPEVDSNGDYIYFNDYQKDGFDIVKIKYDTTSWVPFEKVNIKSVKYYEKIVEQEGNQHLLDNIPGKAYDIDPYNRATGFINPHTWGPEISSSGSAVFAGLESRDVLGTISTNIGYNYDTNEKTGSGLVNVSYQGFFPILDFEYRFGNRSTFENVPFDGGEIRRINFRWKERGLSAGVRLPFNFTRSKYLTNLTFGSKVGITKVKDFNQSQRVFISQLFNGNLRSLEHRVVFNRHLKRSQRDIFSKWGQTWFLNYQHTPIGGDFNGKYLALQGELFLPGLIKHHSLRLTGGYQHQELLFQADGTAPSDTYTFPSYFFFPRGYSSQFFQNLYHFYVDYSFPLVYPDLALGPIVNIQRIKANLFYDYGYGELRGAGNNFNSYGVELSTNVNFFRYSQLIELGIRMSVIPELNDVKFEITIANLGF